MLSMTPTGFNFYNLSYINVPLCPGVTGLLNHHAAGAEQG